MGDAPPLPCIMHVKEIACSSGVAAAGGEGLAAPSPGAVAGGPNVEVCRGFGPKMYGIVQVGSSRPRRVSSRMDSPPYLTVINGRGNSGHKGNVPLSSQLPPWPFVAKSYTRPTLRSGARHGRRRSESHRTSTPGGQQRRACGRGGQKPAGVGLACPLFGWAGAPVCGQGR